ncbi:hypothetical protein [Brachybacterium hainanense]|uniref:SnoaL-like domain-containing protein n=1 Tax=Brachybacterium hainanense TaxID=1541174 RepID=A0ABV6RI19_9MICO
MSAIEIWRRAGETGDPQAAVRALGDGAELVSPFTERFVFRGPEEVEVLLTAVFSVVSGFRYEHEIRDGSAALLVARARVRGVDLHEMQHLELEADGRIRRITLAMRPLTAITALARELGPVLARAHGRPGAARTLRVTAALLDAVASTGERRFIPLAAPPRRG